MKCALCEHRGRFSEVGRTRGDNRRLFRCPRCKYDQAKNLFGVGQFVDHRRSGLGQGIELDVPPETSPIKHRYELELAQSGLLAAHQVVPLDYAAAAEYMAGLAEDQGHPEIAEILGGVHEDAPTESQVQTGHSEHIPSRSVDEEGSHTPDPGVSSRGVLTWDRLTKEGQAEHRQRVVAALDDVIDESMMSLRLSPSDMDETLADWFIQFSRLILKNSLSAYDLVRECGASSEEMPFGQVLAGFRPAVDEALGVVNEARRQLPAKDRPGVEDDPFLQLMTGLSLPVQEATSERLSEGVFIAVQHQTWIDPSEG